MTEIREHPLVLLPLLAPFGLLLWVVFDTYYVIDGQKLRYRSAFVRGEVEIGRIREIVKGKTLWIGIKPALARNGLIVKFNTYDEIYISPENHDAMVERNPAYQVVCAQRLAHLMEQHSARRCPLRRALVVPLLTCGAWLLMPEAKAPAPHKD
jgi:hypothetical protein